MNLPAIFPVNAGKARHAFKNQFADYYALRTKMQKLEFSSALTPEAVAEDKVYLNSFSKVKSCSQLVSSLFNKKDAEEENILSDGLQADVSLYLLNKRTYQATRRRSFTILPGMCSPYKIDGRYSDEGLKFDFPRLRITRENRDDMRVDVSTVKGIEDQVGDDKERYMTLLDEKITRSVVLAPVGRGLWQKAQHKLRHQIDLEDVVSVNNVAKHIKRRKNPRRNSIKKRNSVTSVMSLDNNGAIQRRYSTVSINDNDGDSLKPFNAFNVEDSVKKTYGGILDEIIPPQMVRSAYIPTGVFLGRRAFFPLLPACECIQDFKGDTGHIFIGEEVNMRETNYGLPYYLKYGKENEDKLFEEGGDGEGLHSHELPQMVKATPKPPKKRIFHLFRKAPPHSLELIKSGKIDKSLGGNLPKSEIKVARVRKSDLDLQMENEIFNLRNEGMKLPINVDMNKEIEVSEGLIRRFDINGVDMVHHGALNDAVFSPSELRIATAGGDKLIKIWDPRDGSYVRALKGHKDEVTSVRYTVDELYMVSAGADMEILIWDLTSCGVVRRLQGHSDIITSIAISSDCSLMVSSSMDMYLKTWFLTPRIPDAPDSPIFLSKTDTTVMIKWSSPPAFNLEISAYQLQYRVGLRGLWLPDANTPPKTIPPWSRSIIIPNLEPSQAYQFRLRAENEMGSSKWGGVSKLICTDLGLPTCLERPTACEASMTSITVFWFTPNPAVFTGASTLFHMNYSGDTKSYEQHCTHEVSLEACLVEGSEILERFRTILLDYNLSMIERKHRKAELLARDDRSVRTAEDQNDHVDIDNSDSEADDDIFPIRSAVRATVSPLSDPTPDNPTTSAPPRPSVNSMANTAPRSSGQGPGNELILVGDQINDKRGQSECKLHPLAIEKVMSQLSDEKALFVAYTTTNLAIGCPYRFQVRAVNRLGEGPLSPESYSFSTSSAPPRPPDAPIVEERTITSIYFVWEPPNDLGSAITGYKVFVEHSELEISLPRNQLYWMEEYLLPGSTCRLKVAARNVYGYSEYSPWSGSDSTTLTQKPDNPLSMLVAVDATWCSMTLEACLTYDNGSPITAMEVQMRVIEAFARGPWQSKKVFQIPSDVLILEEVDLQNIMMERQMAALKLRSGIKNGGYNPFEKTRHAKVVKKASAGVYPMVMTSEKNDKKMKTFEEKSLEGSRISFVMEDLLSNSVYEFRVSFRNSTGGSEYSMPSRRAKTNRSNLPGTPNPPLLIDMDSYSVTLLLDLPLCGSDKILHFIVEMKDVKRNIITEEVFVYNAPSDIFEIGESGSSNTIHLTYKKDELISHHVYCFRSKAESLVGRGEMSDWSQDI
eukprot:CAMPEP_0119051514 /NCGR_PEP_ID=MMETSP1177-20130426/73098_1 /TAXON_ID=2985 /ORGANISM="Ochromonas sp, Strain CCMP1899" /LENGTH=1331 /DNA_ID=CAMNT_0007030729 /DNA_START=428 /DNA_END=4420 /DNA_ORIENTATION=-